MVMCLLVWLPWWPTPPYRASWSTVYKCIDIVEIFDSYLPVTHLYFCFRQLLEYISKDFYPTWCVISPLHYNGGLLVSCFYCPPPFRRKVEGHCFWFSVGRGAWRVVRGAWFRVFSGYFVPLTPPTVSVQSFWNFTGVLRMVWRYACGFFRILK